MLDITRIECSKKHKLGNMVLGLCYILDGLTLILSAGNFSPKFALNWSMHRRSTGILCDHPITK